MKVKICGITNKEDAVWALNYGADYLGINFYKESPRHSSIQSSLKWVNELPSFAHVVGVFVNAEKDDVLKTVEKLKIKGLQFHGNESPDYLNEIKATLGERGKECLIVKAIRVKDENDLSSIPPYKGVVDFILLDTRVPHEEGGTGQTFDWDLAVRAKEFGIPIIIAGGLTPANVKKAVKKVDPYGVDVASGVEKSPRKKDTDKIRDFIMNAKG